MEDKSLPVTDVTLCNKSCLGLASMYDLPAIGYRQEKEKDEIADTNY